MMVAVVGTYCMAIRQRLDKHEWHLEEITFKLFRVQ